MYSTVVCVHMYTQVCRYVEGGKGHLGWQGVSFLIVLHLIICNRVSQWAQSRNLPVSLPGQHEGHFYALAITAVMGIQTQVFMHTQAFYQLMSQGWPNFLRRPREQTLSALQAKWPGVYLFTPAVELKMPIPEDMAMDHDIWWMGAAIYISLVTNHFEHVFMSLSVIHASLVKKALHSILSIFADFLSQGCRHFFIYSRYELLFKYTYCKSSFLWRL